MTIRTEGADQSETARLTIVPDGQTSTTFGGYGLTLVGWRQDFMRVRGLVAILNGGEQVKEAWLAPNCRIGRRGKSIFLTA
jgi:hypothetical protein